MLFPDEKRWRESGGGKKKPKPQATPAEIDRENDALEGDGLDEMNLVVLRGIAQEKGVSPWGMNKAELIEAIRGA